MPRKQPLPKGLYWCFTIWLSSTDYNSDDDDMEVYSSKYMVADKIKRCLEFCFWSLEKGSNKKGLAEKAKENGGYHLQGFLKLKDQHDLGWMKKNVHPTAHFEVMRANAAKSFDYCSKDDTHVAGPWEYGERPGGDSGNQGSRSDLSAVQKSLHEVGYKQTTIEHFSPFIKYYRGIQTYCRLHGIPLGDPPRTVRTYTILIYGDADVGKTSWLSNHFLGKYYKLSSTTSNTVWCENFVPGGIAQIDDMEGSVMPMRTFKILVNNASFTIYPRSGDPSEFNPAFLFITAQEHPSKWWPNRYAENIQHLNAVMKRIDTVWHWTRDPNTKEIIRECEKGDSANVIFERFKNLISINPNVEHPSHLSSCFNVDLDYGVVRFGRNSSESNPPLFSDIFNNNVLSFPINYKAPSSEDTGITSDPTLQFTSNGTFIIEDSE